MMTELEEFFHEMFPLMYRQKPPIECLHGWFGLLLEASAEIEHVLRQLPAEERACNFAAQVKEKYGILRLYMISDEHPKIKAAITRAEQRSRVECEACGAAGRGRSRNGWLYCSCERHVRY